MTLPRGYLSFNSMNTWMKSKDQFRQTYYFGKPFRANQEMVFGSEIGRILENNPENPRVKDIPKYMVPELRFDKEVDGVPIMGYIDSYDPVGNAILEYKTSYKPWTRIMVQKLGQLDFYCVAMNATETDLCWIQTKRTPMTKEFGSTIYMSDDYTLEMTGHIEMFHRTITEVDKDHMRKQIVRVANEISEDYQNYLNNI